MDVQIEPSWEKMLHDEFQKPYFNKLAQTIRDAYTDSTVYPPPQFLFNAFQQCPYNDINVVVIGQDPYHGAGQAHGLCFSVQEGVRIPPSLRNIYREIEDDIGSPPPSSGNLERWAKQGVLLLNATLTVQKSNAGSHQGLGWEQFTDAIIKKISDDKEFVVFLLWGKYAQEKGRNINRTKHLVLEAAHPSPFSAHNGFFGCKHFSRANAYLQTHGKTPIVW